MIRRYRNQLNDALNERGASGPPGVPFILAVAIAMTAVFVGLLFLLAPSDKSLLWHLVEEGGESTALSAFSLALASGFSLAAFAMLRQSGSRDAWVWMLLSAGFAFLSLDEMIRFHERAGEYLSGISGTGPFRSWNDLIVIAYGIIALPVFLMIFPVLLRLRWVVEIFSAAFGFYALHTLIDSLNEPPTFWSEVFEESAKLFCGVLLATGSFIGMVGIIWKLLPRRTDASGRVIERRSGPDRNRQDA